MTSPSPAKRFNWSNLRIRVASATVLVPTVVAAVWFGDVWYLGLILVGVALLAREWAEMSAPKARGAGRGGGDRRGRGDLGDRRLPRPLLHHLAGRGRRAPWPPR
jgi:hypothetical protein